VAGQASRISGCIALEASAGIVGFLSGGTTWRTPRPQTTLVFEINTR